MNPDTKVVINVENIMNLKFTMGKLGPLVEPIKLGSTMEKAAKALDTYAKVLTQ